MSAKPGQGGMTLIELFIALGMSSLLLLGLISIASAAGSSSRLQQNQSQIQEHARLAVKSITTTIRETGFTPQPWNDEFAPLGIADTSADSDVRGNDRLVVRTWSDLNCYGNRNPDTDAMGKPLFYIRESAFDMNSSGGLTRHCLYGPSLSEMVPQVRRQGFIENVDSFQVLYGRDSDEDGTLDGWVRAGEWGSANHVLAVRVGLLLASEDSVVEPESRTYGVLDRVSRKRADGKLRRVVQFSTALKGRSG